MMNLYNCWLDNVMPGCENVNEPKMVSRVAKVT